MSDWVLDEHKIIMLFSITWTFNLLCTELCVTMSMYVICILHIAAKSPTKGEKPAFVWAWINYYHSYLIKDRRDMTEILLKWRKAQIKQTNKLFTVNEYTWYFWPFFRVDCLQSSHGIQTQKIPYRVVVHVIIIDQCKFNARETKSKKRLLIVALFLTLWRQSTM